MKKAAGKGKFTKTHLALPEDQMLTIKRKKQVYGSKLNKDSSKESLIWPIKFFPNMNKINKRREKMGLEKFLYQDKDMLREQRLKTSGEVWHKTKAALNLNKSRFCL